MSGPQTASVCIKKEIIGGAAVMSSVDESVASVFYYQVPCVIQHLLYKNKLKI